MQNGGFEQGFASWLGILDVTLSSPWCHEGLISAAMSQSAAMFQDVSVGPGHVYQLQLSVAATGEGEPPDLEIKVLWVGPCAELREALGCDPVVIQGKTTGFWKTAVLYTTPAPPGTDTARICLRTCQREGECSRLLVDDVIFVERD